MENPPMLFLDLDIATWVSSILVFGGLPKGIQWVGVKTLHLLLIFPGDSPKGPVVLPRDRPLRGTCPCGCGWSGNGNHHLKFFLDRSWTPPKKMAVTAGDPESDQRGMGFTLDILIYQVSRFTLMGHPTVFGILTMKPSGSSTNTA
jgi:hypothetical protein